MPDTGNQFDGLPEIFHETTLKKPKMYAVVMHNDNYTTMEFVVDVLMKIFQKNIMEATAIMLDIHKKGSRIVSVYTYDIAVTKSNMAIALAQEKGFPLLVTVKEALE